MRGRFKERGWKANGERSLDMCPHCLRFGCDPWGASPLFRQKVDERRRLGLCPMCGQPKGHCKCKSSEKIAPGAHIIRTHNNKKRRKALQLVKEKEKAYLRFVADEEALIRILGEDMYGDVRYSLRRHYTPELSWEQFERVMRRAELDPLPYQAGWK